MNNLLLFDETQGTPMRRSSPLHARVKTDKLPRCYGANNYQSPEWIVDPLVPYLKKDWRIWEVAAGEGNLANRLRQKGFEVIESDIRPRNNAVWKIDFIDAKDMPLSPNYIGLGLWASVNTHCIITNPPFSLKNQFLQRCYEIGKPFALLLPFTALESEARQKYYREVGLELVLFNKRINFVDPSRRDHKSCSWFPSCWFTWGLNIGKQLTFVKVG